VFSLLILDVDHFKWINDTHGHAAGDMVVQNLADYLKTLVRNGDFVFRFGGDEFAILFNKLEGEIARTVADRIRLAIARHNFGVGQNGERVAVTCSLGLACIAEDDTAETLFVRADEALYRSKRGGRNQLNSDITSTLPASGIPTANEAAPEADSVPVGTATDLVSSVQGDGPEQGVELRLQEVLSGE
jgi:diguanylate cyclase (GGDEF)-like protein